MALSDTEFQNLAPHLELVSLSRSQVLYQPGEAITYVYFPHQAVVSLLSTMEDGSTIEVGLVGREGMAGIPVIMGGNITNHQAFVQVPGDAMRLKAEVLKAEFNRGSQLQILLLRYIQALLAQISQSVACNRFHTVEQRLARWILLVQDSTTSNQLPLTQEFLAQMLGTRRSSVTVAAGTLSQAGMISYSRGCITVLDREALEVTSCECYKVIKDTFAQSLNNQKI